MTELRHRYLIAGQPRGLLADALVEYRRFAARHPGDSLADYLLDVAGRVRLALRDERALLRAAGVRGKPNADCGRVSRRVRRDRFDVRRERLERKRIAGADDSSVAENVTPTERI